MQLTIKGGIFENCFLQHSCGNMLGDEYWKRMFFTTFFKTKPNIVERPPQLWRAHGIEYHLPRSYTERFLTQR